MEASLYSQVLEPEERRKCMALGATFKCAEAGITANHKVAKQLDPLYQSQDLTKSAQLSDIADTGLQTLLLTSLVTGIPLGAAAHFLGQSTDRSTRETREKEMEIKHYREAAKELDAEMRIQNL